MTLQTLGVMLIGLTFGFRLATATVALYLIEGAIGLPVYADFSNLAVLIAKPYSAGYLVGFLFAAALMGFMADRGVTKSWVGMLVTLLAGEIVVFAFGVAFLSYLIGIDAGIKGGLYPFVIPDLIKLALAFVLGKGVIKGASNFANL
jgi:biotin transport system substrate-specific component